ncbi:2-alkenal reductase (NADP(+)-dependent)-like [Papaver somniferum]|uniref:2-alkenal reductase (NADP(+)-dependent)-like n=1 Tax=Papaver somniferum TaxID=3469 RepID=UPI000E6F4897|nr:2-alkenal reductase (NADP(+)-dependent)-like [Papaver somniferum]
MHLMNNYVLRPLKKILKSQVNLLKNKFGFDDAFNYKDEPDRTATLKRYLPKGIDIYFENVGGKILEVVLPNTSVHGRIPVCGMISRYNLQQHDGVHNLTQLLKKRVHMEGFNVSDHYHLYTDFMGLMKQYFMDEKLFYVEDMVEGIESAPVALVGLFTGQNIGKQVVKVSHE